MQGISSLLSGLSGLLQNLEIQDPTISRQFMVGEKLIAQVVSKEGDNYLVQSGSRLFLAQSELILNPGDKLLLLVSEQKDGRTMLKVQQPAKSGSAETILPNADVPEFLKEEIQQLAAKYGFTSEKELGQLVEQLAKLPLNEKAGVRYLLDPHLAAAVIIPPQTETQGQTKIEIEQYKGAADRQQIWEVSFTASLATLGPVEIMLKMVAGKVYARIWAERKETEDLLRSRQQQLELQAALVEIVPVSAGPLLPRESKENVDLRV